MMKLDDALAHVSEKFTSGNSVPVDRAIVTREEWDAIRKRVERRVVADEMVLNASRTYNSVLFTTAATHEEAMRAALQAALGGE